MTKLVPYDEQAEQAVLGSILLDNSCANEVIDRLDVNDFFAPSNKAIYKGMVKLAQARKPIDPVTLRSNVDGEYGAEISHLLVVTPTSYDVLSYVEIVEKMSFSRKLIQIGDQIQGLGYSCPSDLSEALSSSESLLKQINIKHDDLVLARSQAEDVFQMLERNRDGKQIIKWGFLDLDNLTGGIMAGDLMYVGARPSTGKSELLTQIALKASKRGENVLFASLEMNKNQMSERMAAILNGANISDIRHGDPKAETAICNAAGTLSELPLSFLYGPRYVSNLRMNIERTNRNAPLKLIIVDHIGKFKDLDDRKAGDNLIQRVGYVSRTLFEIAKETNIPILVASQLNRRSEVRDDKRPVLSDLRESGDLEQDADLVLMLHRPQKYDPNLPNTLEILVAKNRQFDAGQIINLGWHYPSHQYVDLTRHE